MTPQEINTAIAELCGWERIGRFVAFEGRLEANRGGSLFGWRTGKNGNKWQGRIPDYYHDLNACHSMEETLSGMAILAYRQLLVEITTVPFDIENEIDIRREIFHATAPQRCEAFLKTHGKRKE